MAAEFTDDGFVSIAGSEAHPQFFTAEQWRSSAQARPEDLAWWTDARFGLFIHFGVSSVLGVELGWGRHTRVAPDSGAGPVPTQQYDQLHTEFALEEFNSDHWVELAKDAGMRYLVVVSKHHDGFHLWHTETSDYSIAATPFQRDYLGEVIAACHRADFPVGLYYSQRDWYHPHYDPDAVMPGRQHNKYIDYQFEAVRELLTNYGKIDILWFDAAFWSGMFEAEDWESERLNQMARELQPHILINNRASIPGDFDTPEQQVGSASRRRPWESCITLGSAWAWKPDDAIKSAAETVHLLTQTLGGDGNLLLNVGPKPDGTIEDRQVAVLHEVGAWARRHSDLLYGSRGGPFLPGEWGASTCIANRVHVFAHPDLNAISLPSLPVEVLDVKAHEELSASVSWTSTDTEIRINLPSQDDGYPKVVTLTLDANAFDLEPVTVPERSWPAQ